MFTNIKDTNCTRLPLSSQSIAHNTGEMVYNVQFLINDFVLDDPRDTQVVKINIDESPQTPGTYGIRSIPTVLVFKDGQVVSQLTGARPKGDFDELVNAVV